MGTLRNQLGHALLWTLLANAIWPGAGYAGAGRPVPTPTAMSAPKPAAGPVSAENALIATLESSDPSTWKAVLGAHHSELTQALLDALQLQIQQSLNRGSKERALRLATLADWAALLVGKPDNYRIGLALMHARAEAFDLAFAIFNQVINEQPRHPLVFIAQGFTYEQRQDWPRAVTAYDQATKVTPRNQEAWLYLAKACVQAGDDTKARAAYQHLLLLDPNNAAALAYLTPKPSAAFTAPTPPETPTPVPTATPEPTPITLPGGSPTPAETPEVTVTVSGAATVVPPATQEPSPTPAPEGTPSPERVPGSRIQRPLSANTNALAHYTAAEAKFTEGDYRKAVEEYQKALGYDNRFARALIHLGRSYVKLRMYQEAMTAFGAGTDSDPQDPEGFYYFGDLNETLFGKYPGNYDFLRIAYTCYSRAVQLDPQYVEAKDGLQRVGAKLSAPQR